jgi:ubiquinone/menaquinone biosynthesis C-methylase UbiE
MRWLRLVTASKNVNQALAPCGNELWEKAYARFETPAQEIRKFTRRLTKLGVAKWSRRAEIVELCCGRGNGLHALSQLGLTKRAGVDLSASLIAQYKGPATSCVYDCRQLPFDTQSKHIVIVQGGLHHLKNFPDDVETTLSETWRVLRNAGLCVVVEPWLTPFLSVVHGICRSRIARCAIPKIDALATMIEYEHETYYQWLAQSQMIISLFDRFFVTDLCLIKWVKCTYRGRKRDLR